MKHMFYAGDAHTSDKVEKLLKEKSIEFERKNSWFYFNSEVYNKDLMKELFFYIADLYRKTKKRSARVQ